MFLLYFIFCLAGKNVEGRGTGSFILRVLEQVLLGESGESVTIFWWWGAKFVSHSPDFYTQNLCL